MMKKLFSKKFALLVLLIMIAGCIPMSEASVDRKAASVAERTIAQKEREKQRQEEARQKKREKTKRTYDLADEQVLNISGRSFDDLNPENADGEAMNLISLVFPGLTRYDAESGEFLPVLAKSWEVSEDLLTWTFTLRDDVPWVTYDAETEQIEQVMGEDGDPLYVTAEDVKARIMDVIDPNQYFNNYYLLLSITGAMDYVFNGAAADLVQIETPSDTEVIIHLEEPDSGFLALTELPIFSATPSWNDPYDITMAVNFYGPYVPTDPISFNYNTVTIIKNPFWAGTDGLEDPFLETINIDMQYGQDVISAFKNGELDAVSLTYEEYLEASSDPELSDDLISAPANTGYYLLFFNTGISPIDEATGRKEVASAIDKTSLVALPMETTGTVMNGIIPDFLRDEPFEGITFDEDFSGSEQENSSASVNYLNFLYIEDGSTFSLAEYLTDQLRSNLGREIYTIPMETYYDLFTNIENNYTYDPGIYLLPLNMMTNDPQEIWDSLSSEIGIKQMFQEDWTADDFANLYNEAKLETDSSKRFKLYEKMEEIMVNEDVMVIPLFWTEQHWLVRSDVGAEILPLYQQLENWARIIP